MTEMKKVLPYRFKRKRTASTRQVRPKGWSSAHGYRNTEAASVRHWAEEGRVEVTINIDGLCKMLVEGAVFNKTGKTKYLNGLVKAKVIERKEFDAEVLDVPLHKDNEVVE